MRILLLGYGKMGQAIESLATERGHAIVDRIDQPDEAAWSKLAADTVDVAIEFSQPDAAVNNIRKCLTVGIPIVSGTTGWLDQKPTLDEYCQQQNGTFFYASNFSIGVNLLFRLSKYLAAAMSNYPEYRPSLEEIHHTEKKDAPSGTALTLVEGVLAALPQVSEWILREEGQQVSPSDHQLLVHSVREGQVPGTHIVRYQSETDDIEIKHTAHSRRGFALGAVLVAEWLPHQKGVLGMNDFLSL